MMAARSDAGPDARGPRGGATAPRGSHPVGGSAAVPGLLGRRAALRGAASAAGLAAAGAFLAACGPSKAAGGTSGSASASLTAAAANAIHILWRPWYNFNEATTKTGESLMMQGIQPWLAKNSGVNVEITFMGYQATTVAALLAGNGPDIFADWVLPLFTEPGLLLNLSPYVKQSNVNLGEFPARDMEVFEQNGGLWALPSYLHLEAPAVNLGILDNLGLSYPEPGWTYTQWTQLWEQTATKAQGGKPGRVGAQFYWEGYDGHGGAPAPYYLKGFGGEYVDPSDSTRCYLSSSGSAQAFEWLYGLLASGVCNTGGSNFQSGGITVSTADTAGGLIGSAESWRSLKWQIYDEPVYPSVKTAFAASDFYAISAATARPDIVWDFMQYLCVGPDWQNWMVKLAMNGPNQAALYPQWEATVKAVAPPLANIDLGVFTTQMQNNEPYFGLLYAYDDPQAGSIVSAVSSQIQGQKVSVPAGLAQATQQVNALEATAKTTAASAASAAKKFPVNGKTVAAVPTGI